MMNVGLTSPVFFFLQDFDCLNPYCFAIFLIFSNRHFNILYIFNYFWQEGCFGTSQFTHLETEASTYIYVYITGNYNTDMLRWNSCYHSNLSQASVDFYISISLILSFTPHIQSITKFSCFYFQIISLFDHVSPILLQTT